MQSEAKAKALEQFTDYFVNNYPGPDTIIFNPYWHAPKIFAAAYSAITAALVDVPAVEPVAWLRPCRITYLSGEQRDGHIVSIKKDPKAFPVYTSPPLTREGEDSAEVMKIITALRHAASGIADRLQQTAAIDNAIAFLAATRSGSATTASGGRDDG
jgi:hypothetical protein